MFIINLDLPTPAKAYILLHLPQISLLFHEADFTTTTFFPGISHLDLNLIVHKDTPIKTIVI